MRRYIIVGAAAVGFAGIAVARGTAAWRGERRAKTVFPARDASSLLHPLRPLKDPPRAMILAFGVGRGERVLEIGPGPGYFTREAARIVGDGGAVVALDIQPAMLAALARSLREQAHRRVRSAAGDAMHLPFRDASFDRAYLVAVLGEVPDAAAAVRELRRVVRPGGTIAFSETLSDPDYVREGELRRLCAEAGLGITARRRHLLGFTLRCAVPAAASR